MRSQELSILDRVSFNCRERFRSVRYARCVAQIDKALVREMFMQRAIDGESANATVEDADGKITIQGLAPSSCTRAGLHS